MDKKDLALCLYSLVLLASQFLIGIRAYFLGIQVSTENPLLIEQKLFLIKIYVIVWVRNVHDSLVYLSISRPIQW